MGLKYRDLDSWSAWQRSRRRLQVAKAALLGRHTGGDEPAKRWWIRGSAPSVLVACDSTSPTNHHSLVAPLSHPDAPDALLVHPEGLDLQLDPNAWRPLGAPNLGTIQKVISIGDHLSVGAWAHQQAGRRGWSEIVVQHGLLSPFSPPPPRSAHFLAWSEPDAVFISEGRSDLHTQVVGSPLLAAAAALPAPHVSRFQTPVFLGQLHGAELSRASMTRSVTAFWRETGAIYRPHPREEDKLSRTQHALWRSMGMSFDTTGQLASLNAPVVGAFSTGILEAAARGVPAWVFHVDPPTWLEDLWDRYALSRWGSAPTPIPDNTTNPWRMILNEVREVL